MARNNENLSLPEVVSLLDSRLFFYGSGWLFVWLAVWLLSDWLAGCLSEFRLGRRKLNATFCYLWCVRPGFQPEGPPGTTKMEESALHHFGHASEFRLGRRKLNATFCYLWCVRPGFQPEGPPGHTKMEESALHHFEHASEFRLGRRKLNATFCYLCEALSTFMNPALLWGFEVVSANWTAGKRQSSKTL